MPATLSYPGVYIEEIPSGVRTIVGVATSITAFIGRAAKGTVNEPITIGNFGDFERQFGGLGIDYPMSYAVRDFYLNGGGQAIVVRLYKDPDDNPTTPSNGYARLLVGTSNGLSLIAKMPGLWGQNLRATVDKEVSEDVRKRLGLSAADELFNLTVQLGNRSEKFLNLTVTDNARRIDRVLEAESSWVRWNGAWLATAPHISDLDDAVTKAEKALAAEKAAKPQDNQKIQDAETALNAAKSAMQGSDGKALDQAAYEGNKDNKSGLYALDKADLFNLLCIPPDTRAGDVPSAVYQTALAYCTERRAMLIVDPPSAWSANKDTAAATAKNGLAGLGLAGDAGRNAALYFPRVRQADPLRDGQIDTFVPCGIVAGAMARTDTRRGIWKAPAGLETGLNGIQGIDVNLNDGENGQLNPLGINCLRAFPTAGGVIWGARTLAGADQLASEWKYIPVRRTALYIEESLYRGTQWAVFEPNDEPLWAQLRLNVGAFMHNLFQQGAFQGRSAREAYFVKCDNETNPQSEINLGIVNVVVGFAPLKPAEFVVVKLQQMAGQIQT